MKRLPLFASVVVLGVGMMLVFHSKGASDFPKSSDSIEQATNGAFRDGVYLGALAAKRGAEPHVAIGRWATGEDRASFTAGYEQGYQGYLVSRAGAAKHAHQAD